MKMVDNVTFIIYVNLRGAQLAEKRKDVLNFMKKKKILNLLFARYRYHKERRKLR